MSNAISSFSDIGRIMKKLGCRCGLEGSNPIAQHNVYEYKDCAVTTLCVRLMETKNDLAFMDDCARNRMKAEQEAPRFVPLAHRVTIRVNERCSQLFLNGTLIAQKEGKLRPIDFAELLNAMGATVEVVS